MEKQNKRISKRVYPKRNCIQCTSEFIPHDAREIYCCEQHRVDYNNDKSKTKNARLKDLNAKMINNEKILKKFYEALQDQKQELLTLDILILDGYDLNVPSELSISNSGNKIEWQLSFGLEGVDKPKRLFKINKR